MKQVRVFFTLCTIIPKTDRYKKDRMERDFPETTHYQDAYDSIWREFGQRGRDDRTDMFGLSLAPMRYADIQGWSVVEADRPKPELETFKAWDQDLLSPTMLRDALSRKPERK